MREQQMFTLVKVEDPTWTIFHTNVHNERLKEVRQRYLNRRGVERFMNASNFTAKFPDGVYYGKLSSLSLVQRARVAVGASKLGPVWRSLKRTLKAGGEPG